MINESWDKLLNLEYQKEYFINLKNFIENEYKKTVVLPPREYLFNAFKLTKFEDVKVVIIGQDPYHGLNQANGLAFSVNKGEKVPPSLRNIFIELNNDLKLGISKNGDLTKWALEGVLLLNTCLSVVEKKPGSHKNIGWEKFIQNVIIYLNNYKENIVFIFWGNFAKKFTEYIDQDKHLIITSSHPSPLSVKKGFFGSKPFSKTNEYLLNNNKSIIDWNL